MIPPRRRIEWKFDCTGNDSGMMNEFAEEPPPAKSAGEATKARRSGSRDPVFGDRGGL